ncbi:MAG: hypothetical protein M4579_004529 [Chaenotheca gracillima]|nr:MAG: hypothetical protein M4579_004529 [Chaenotheca gracillima]
MASLLIGSIVWMFEKIRKTRAERKARKADYDSNFETLKAQNEERMSRLRQNSDSSSESTSSTNKPNASSTTATADFASGDDVLVNKDSPVRIRTQDQVGLPDYETIMNNQSQGARAVS